MCSRPFARGFPAAATTATVLRDDYDVHARVRPTPRPSRKGRVRVVEGLCERFFGVKTFWSSAAKTVRDDDDKDDKGHARERNVRV